MRPPKQCDVPPTCPPTRLPPPPYQQEDDCIGIMPPTDKISDMKPLGDRVLIKCAKAASSTTGGVLLANDAGDKPTFGEVSSCTQWGAGSGLFLGGAYT